MADFLKLDSSDGARTLYDDLIERGSEAAIFDRIAVGHVYKWEPEGAARYARNAVKLCGGSLKMGMAANPQLVVSDIAAARTFASDNATSSKKDNKAMALQLQAELSLVDGQVGAAIASCASAAAAYKDLKDSDNEAMARHKATLIHLAAGSRTEAEKSSEATRAVFKHAKEWKSEAAAVLAFADANLSMGITDNVVTVAKEALDLYKKLGSKDGVLAARVTLANAYIKDKLGFDALKIVEEIAEDAGSDKKKKGAAMQLVSDVQLRCLGNAEEALSRVQEAEDLYRSAKATEAEADALLSQAYIEIARGNINAAAKPLLKAREVAQKGKHKHKEEEVLRALVECSLSVSRVPEARGLAEDALSVAQGLDDKYGEASALHSLANCALQSDDTVGAIEHATKMLELSRESGNAGGEAAALHMLANASLTANNWSDDGFVSAKEAVDLFKAVGDILGGGAAFQTLANACFVRGELAQGLEAARQALMSFRMLGDNDSVEVMKETIEQARITVCQQRRLAGSSGHKINVVESVPSAPVGPGETVSNKKETLAPGALDLAINRRKGWGVPSIMDPDEEPSEPRQLIIYGKTIADFTSNEVCTDIAQLCTVMAKRDVKVPIVCLTYGVYGRQACEVAGAKVNEFAGVSLWGMVRCIRQEMPAVIMAMCDISHVKTIAQVSRHMKPNCLESMYYHNAKFEPLVEPVNSMLRGAKKVESAPVKGATKTPFMRKAFPWTQPNNKMDFCWYRQSWRIVDGAVYTIEEPENYPANDYL